MAKDKKLNSMRVLEQHNIPYEVLTYDSGTRDAEAVAELLGLPAFMVYKTLVVQSVTGGKPFLVMLPADEQLDLKRMATGAGEKKVALVPHAEAEKLTGLQVGGISALMLLQKQWRVYLDQSATALEHIVISAGQRGVQLRIPVTPLMGLLRATLVEVVQE